MASENIKDLDTSNFSDTIQGDTPVLVDFWAPWCGPCKAVAPTLEQIAAERDGQVVIAKVNVDDNQKLAAEHGVRGIPMFVLFEGGQPKGKLTGAMPKAAFDRFLDENLPSGATAA